MQNTPLTNLCQHFWYTLYWQIFSVRSNPKGAVSIGCKEMSGQSFGKGESVIWKRDCYSYSILAEFDKKDTFKEKCECEIYECGLSHFYIDENEQFIEHLEDCEWCCVELVGEGYDSGLGIGDIIRVKDLERTGVHHFQWCHALANL